MAGNNKANVSTVRAVSGGYFFSAPIGTAGAPTKTNYRPSDWLSNGEPPEGWECLGYIVEDGFTENPNKSAGDAIRDINLDKLDETDSTADESCTVGMREIKRASLGTYYGHDNVTDSGGTIEVQHNWGKSDEHRQYVFLLLLKNGRYWTKYVPDGKVNELTEHTYNKTTPFDSEVTIGYNTDDGGTGCYDWIDSTETPAPTLSALSGVTLTPTFNANTRAYTATSSSTSVSLTATAATGNTVSIKDANGNSYSSGNSIPIVSGTNRLRIVVTTTATGAKGEYTLTITKS